MKKYEPYKVDYDQDTSVKPIETLRSNVIHNTAVRIIIHSGFARQ